MLHSIAQDIRFALRGMAARPSFTTVVLATLALGIGANAAIFSVVSGVLLHPLAYGEPERIVQVRHHEPYWNVSEPEFLDYRREVRAFERLAAYTTSAANLTGNGEPERIEGARVSDGFFAALGTRPRLGRVFLPAEDVPGAERVVVLSDGLWRRRFGGEASVIGRTVRLDGEPVTVVGVMPPGFEFPSAATAVWEPLRLDVEKPWGRNNHYLQLVGRLASGATIDAARAQMTALDARWMSDYPETYAPGKLLIPAPSSIADEVLGQARPYLLALLAAVGFVLLIACVNVANLLLARGESRRKELAIRTALGASRLRLARQALTESAIFALAGGALGLALAWALTHALVALAPEGIPRLGEVRLDGAVLAFTLALALATGFLFGLAPAVRGARGDVQGTLREGGKTSSAGRGFTRARGALVVIEVALSVVMLGGAGLMVRSLLALQSIELGFRPEHVLTATVNLAQKEYDAPRAVAFYDALLGRVRALPGVRDAAVVGQLPVADGNSIWSILVDGMGMRSVADAPSAMPQQVTPGYFAAMGIPLVRGRVFAAADRAGAPLVAVVNETMARTLWPGKDAVGGTLKMLDTAAKWVTVVGIVKDVRSSGFQGDVPSTMYFPYAQAKESAYYTPTSMSLVVRTGGDPLALAGAVRAAVRTMDRNAPVTRVRSMEDVVAGSVASRRYSTMLLAGFAALALLLAGVGIYGVISYAVSERTFEIGVRVALGAPRGAVLALMLGEGMRLAAIGLVLGLAGALAAARLLGSLLVGVSPLDVPTLAVVALSLGAVALLASYVPARRAARVDPLHAMREQ